MRHAQGHGKSSRHSQSWSLRRPVTAAKGRAIAPPLYGLDFLDRQQSTGLSHENGGLTLQRQVVEDSSASPGAGEHTTSLPTDLQTGMERLSGLSLAEVQVHYNSAKPAQLQALAYTQGTEIHLAPGQERHLPHEAWHVVQQKQGRVAPTFHAMGVAINDDQALEKEATLMGDKARQRPPGKGFGAERSTAEAMGKKSVWPRVLQRVTAPAYTNASIAGVYNGAVTFTDSGSSVLARSPALNLTGTVDITQGEPASQNSGIQIGFVQTLVKSSGTAKYKPYGGKEERAQLALAPQPIRDGTAGETPWYEKNDAVSWDGNDIVGLSTTLYDRPQTPFPKRGKEDGQEIYGIEGKDEFKTWLIAWKDRSAKYLYWYTWTVNFSGTKAGGIWTAAGASTNTGSGAGAGRNPNTAQLGDPVANDKLSWRWRKV